MPPRSLCLNVFTGPLNKEAQVVVNEVREKNGASEERARHDSIQEDSISTTTSFTQSISTTNASPITSTAITTATLPDEVRAHGFSSTLPTICSTCIRPPPSGHPLLRCSRCKRAYYCSRTCQKQAWKNHKAECDPASAPSPSSAPSPRSALDTPDVSVPGSPAQATDEHQFNLAAPISQNVISQCGAIDNSIYSPSATTAHQSAM